MKRIVTVALSALALTAAVGLTALNRHAPAPDARPDPAAARNAFESLKALEGTWMMVDDAGVTTDEIASIYHVTAGGSAVMETMFPGQPHEMLTVYFIEDETLTMTHYCMLGNRPQLAANSIVGPRIEWACSASSHCCGTEQHMHAATFNLASRDEITTTWRGDKDDDTAHEVTFTLRRAPQR